MEPTRKIYQGTYDEIHEEVIKDEIAREDIGKTLLKPCLTCKRWIYEKEFVISKKLDKIKVDGKYVKIDNPIFLKEKCIYCKDEDIVKLYPKRCEIHIEGSETVEDNGVTFNFD